MRRLGFSHHMLGGVIACAFLLMGTGSRAQFPTKNLLDVGFDMPVTLRFKPAVTNGLTPPLTYKWSQVAGRAVTLTPNKKVANPSFTTGPLTDFVDLEPQVGLVPINTENVDDSTYEFQVIATGATGVRTGRVLVVAASTSPAQPNLPLGVNQYFQAAAGEPSNSWTLVSQPAGSTALLVGANTAAPSLRPDLEGDYVVRDNVTGTNLTVTGATYVGWKTCAPCHGPNPTVPPSFGIPQVGGWKQTKHASMAKRGLNGKLGSEPYDPSCFACHTVGFNTAPRAVNGGFDDVARAVGWQFPATPSSTNYAALPAALKDLANIQCENCHGPGSLHPGARSINLDVGVCATCHQNGFDDHARPAEWKLSPHFTTDDPVKFGHAVNSCATKCHNPQGFIDATRGDPPPATPAIGKISCAVCHDPHNGTTPHLLRVFDSVTLGDLTLGNGTVTLTSQGPSALCMYCHNGRALPLQLSGAGTNAAPVYLASLPHESTAAEMLNGIGGVTFGHDLGNSPHQSIVQCVDCHMHPVSIDAGGGVTSGDHTFSMTDRITGADNVATCNRCHAGEEVITDFDAILPLSGDYDGDGVVAGVQTETQGLLDLLTAKLLDSGVHSLAGYPFWSGFATNNPALFAAQRAAVWNHDLVQNERSFGVHNTQYAVALLQLTWTVLNTNLTGDVTATFPIVFPNATIRY